MPLECPTASTAGWQLQELDTMTTLVALTTRDALVMGCDSLATFIRTLVDPFDLVEYFDDDFNTKLGADGKPLLDDFSKVYDRAETVPYAHMTHMDKLFALEPCAMGLMFAGEVAIGDRTVKNLIAEFKSSAKFRRVSATQYTLHSVASELLRFLWRHYSTVHQSKRRRPGLEAILGGYDKNRHTPGIIRLHVAKNELDDPDYDFGLYFGGQVTEIARLVHGTDAENKIRLTLRSRHLLERYRELLQKDLKSRGAKVKLKQPQEFGDELELFHDWGIEGLDANIGAFSEQNAIECVDFLVSIMIKSQQFSAQMPTVGGAVQLAVVKRATGLTWISKREWQHGDHCVPITE